MDGWVNNSKGDGTLDDEDIRVETIAGLLGFLELDARNAAARPSGENTRTRSTTEGTLWLRERRRL